MAADDERRAFSGWYERQHMPEQITVELAPDEADAIVYAVTLAITIEADQLAVLRVSTLPGDLYALSESAKRIARLTEVNAQLEWRAHRGKIDAPGEPEITADPLVLLDVLAVLVHRAQQQDQYGDDEVDGAFRFDEAGRTIAAAFANRAVGAAA